MHVCQANSKIKVEATGNRWSRRMKKGRSQGKERWGGQIESDESDKIRCTKTIMGTWHILFSREGYLSRDNYKGTLYKLCHICMNSNHI